MYAIKFFWSELYRLQLLSAIAVWGCCLSMHVLSVLQGMGVIGKFSLVWIEALLHYLKCLQNIL